ncbi:unnamed protein product [Heligmosomoides polygyrus]|uniref:Uncharacterized protein n=1 Tax=Heligmosomoides polygyrus TaxID=6339 RepID=A0A183FAH6_HELPZ|nr:unnamed protein product [Heligmosomoides polygyrus]
MGATRIDQKARGGGGELRASSGPECDWRSDGQLRTHDVSAAEAAELNNSVLNGSENSPGATRENPASTLRRASSSR